MAMVKKPWLTGVLLTASFTGLLAIAISEQGYLFSGVSWLIIVAAAGAIYWMFPHSRYFALSLANFIGVYACIYRFLIETNFANVGQAYLLPGFMMPVIFFVAGTWLRRKNVRRDMLRGEDYYEKHFFTIFYWLAPMFAVAAATFVLPGMVLGPDDLGIVLLVAMGSIGVIIFAISENVAAFLIETGLLFETFFQQIERLVVPAFAFVTFYSLNVMIFAAIYRIVDRATVAAQFQVNTKAVEITFSDAVYLSIMTLSTVGYGDIVPATGLVRVVAAFQVMSGVLLLLFGFNEILRYSREHSGKGPARGDR